MLAQPCIISKAIQYTKESVDVTNMIKRLQDGLS